MVGAFLMLCQEDRIISSVATTSRAHQCHNTVRDFVTRKLGGAKSSVITLVALQNRFDGFMQYNMSPKLTLSLALN